MEFELFKTEILKLRMFGPIQPTKLMTQKDVLQTVGMTATEASYSVCHIPLKPQPKGFTASGSHY
jgi:hypothetical protein